MKSTMATRKKAAGKTRILIVDDHPIVRSGLRQLIEREQDLVVCGEAEDAALARDAIRSLKPDLMITDITLKASNGIDLIKDLRAMGEELPVLVVSVHDEATHAERALRAGAQGYIMKREAPDLIVKGIRKVLGGDVYVCDAVATRLLSKLGRRKDIQGDSPVACLSDRELEVLELTGEGLGTKEIADQLHLSVSTVETHKANIKIKLNLNTAAQMTRFATEWVLSQR